MFPPRQPVKSVAKWSIWYRFFSLFLLFCRNPVIILSNTKYKVKILFSTCFFLTVLPIAYSQRYQWFHQWLHLHLIWVGLCLISNMTQLLVITWLSNFFSPFKSVWVGDEIEKWDKLTHLPLVFCFQKTISWQLIDEQNLNVLEPGKGHF